MEPTLVVIGLNHRTAPIEVRERFWMSEERQREALSALTRSEGIEEVFVFSTCNRTEFVVWGDPTLAENSVLRFLSAEYDLRLCEWSNFYRLLDEQALAHAFRVSCGLDAMHIGEGQIGRQVNAAWQQARKAGCTGRFLDAVLRKALAVRRRVRKETSAGFNLESAPHAAVELAAEMFGALARRNVVLLGAGRMNEASAQALLSRGAESVCVINHSDERAERLARRLGIQTAAFEERWARLAGADLVISATSSAGFVLTAEEMKPVVGQRAGGKLVVMDLALPRDVDPAVRQLDGILLYDLDDLERALKPRAGTRESEAEAEQIVLAEVQAFRKELTAKGAGAEIGALRHRLDEICRQELESFRLEQGPFPKEQDQLIAAVGARITHKIAGSLARERGSRL
ncbi:MAG: glutamyl-tRNA reductase [Acidobacteriales bacterium]|nr:glutamyl-tRNA reductase [Terriglobales bacterium]